MTTTAIFNNFKQADFWRNRYTRGSSIQIRNANLHHGDIRPFSCPVKLCDDKPFKTLYPLLSCECFGFSYLTDIVSGFCSDQHFYISASGQLHQATESELCDNGNTCLAGAPFNPKAPAATADCDNNSCDSVGTSYVITYITEHAGIRIESAPSPASNPIAIEGHIPNSIVNWESPPTGYCIVETRLYRVESSFEDGSDSLPSEGHEYVLVQAFDPSTISFRDDVPTGKTGQPLVTYEPMAFPAPNNLIGLARTDDGIVVADKNRIYISESGKPQFTWDGVVEIEDTIIAIRAIGNTIFVFTDKKPVKLGYRHTDGVMSIDKQVIDRHLPLSSIPSLSVYDNMVYFSSTFSLYRWSTSSRGSDLNAELLQLLTSDQWKSIGSDSVCGTAHELGYMMTSDNMNYSLMIEYGSGGADTKVGTHIMPIDYINPDAFGLDYQGHIVYQEDNKIYRWDYRRDDCGSFEIHDHPKVPLCKQCDCCPWTAWIYVDNEGKNRFSKMRVEFDERSGDTIMVSFYLQRFGQEKKIVENMEIIKSRGFSIPKFCSSQTFMAQLKSCGIMHEVRFSTSSQELVNSSNSQVVI